MSGTIALRVSGASAAINVGARPSGVGQFADVSHWRLGGFAPRIAIAEFTGTLAAELTPVVGALGIELWGVVRSQMKLLSILRANPVQIVAADRGYAEELQDIGMATALYVAAVVSAGDVSVIFTPADVRP